MLADLSFPEGTVHALSNIPTSYLSLVHFYHQIVEGILTCLSSWTRNAASGSSSLNAFNDNARSVFSAVEHFLYSSGNVLSQTLEINTSIALLASYRSNRISDGIIGSYLHHRSWMLCKEKGLLSFSDVNLRKSRWISSLVISSSMIEKMCAKSGGWLEEAKPPLTAKHAFLRVICVTALYFTGPAPTRIYIRKSPRLLFAQATFQTGILDS